jgi:hypothetical protein
VGYNRIRVPIYSLRIDSIYRDMLEEHLAEPAMVMATTMDDLPIVIEDTALTGIRQIISRMILGETEIWVLSHASDI